METSSSSRGGRSAGQGEFLRLAWPFKYRGVQQGEVASHLAAVLRPAVDDVGKDEPARHCEVGACRQLLSESHAIQGLHVFPKALVLLEAGSMDGRRVVEQEPVVPHARVP